MKLNGIEILALLLLLSSCAGIGRSWTAGCNEKFGADWVIAQFDMNGKPFNCWTLHGDSVTNENASDGIVWKDRDTGHMVHLAGWYNRVMVSGGAFEEAANEIGIDLALCKGGHYPALVGDGLQRPTSWTGSRP